jgi:hypothetical protein
MDIIYVLRDALPFRRGANVALQHLMAMAFWDGAYGTWTIGMLLYYVTYVLEPDTAYFRTTIIFLSGISAGGTEAILNIVYMRTFGKGDSRRDKSGRSDRQLLNFVVGMRVMNALLTVVLIGFLPPSVPIFIFWGFACRVGVCGFTFWKISAKCWLIDEDCHAHLHATLSQKQIIGEDEHHREGTLFSTIALMQNIARAVVGSLLMIGLSVFGLKTINCEDRCGTDDNDCMEDCFRDIVGDQPNSLRMYCKVALGFIAPLCEICLAFHAYSFPIKGLRLRRLYHTVMEKQGDYSYLEARPDHAQGDIVTVTQAHPARSKVAIIAESMDDVSQPCLQTRLKSVVDEVQRRKGCSCAVIIETLDDITSEPSQRSGKSLNDAGNGQVQTHHDADNPELRAHNDMDGTNSSGRDNLASHTQVGIDGNGIKTSGETPSQSGAVDSGGASSESQGSPFPEPINSKLVNPVSSSIEHKPSEEIVVRDAIHPDATVMDASAVKSSFCSCHI